MISRKERRERKELGITAGVFCFVSEPKQIPFYEKMERNEMRKHAHFGYEFATGIAGLIVMKHANCAKSSRML